MYLRIRARPDSRRSRSSKWVRRMISPPRAEDPEIIGVLLHRFLRPVSGDQAEKKRFHLGCDPLTDGHVQVRGACPAFRPAVNILTIGLELRCGVRGHLQRILFRGGCALSHGTHDIIESLLSFHGEVGQTQVDSRLCGHLAFRAHGIIAEQRDEMPSGRIFGDGNGRHLGRFRKRPGPDDG